MKAILFLIASAALCFGQEVWTLRHQPEEAYGAVAAGGRPGLYAVGYNTRPAGASQKIYNYAATVNGANWSPTAYPFAQKIAATPTGIIGAGFYGVWTADSTTSFQWSWETDALGNVSGVASGNGWWVIVCENGRIYRASSPAGPWARQLSPAANISGVAFGGGVFLATTGNQTIKSTDAISWATSGVQWSPLVGYSQGRFFTEDSTSQDAGATWQDNYRDIICASDSTFLESEQMGEFNISPDLHAWKKVSSGTAEQIGKVAFCGDIWIAATMSGSVVTSPVVGTPVLTAPPVAIKPAVELSWPSVTGRQYRVQGSTNNTTWTDVGLPILGNGSTLTFTAPANETRKFFRVEAR